jgi:hypothetical protein
MLGSGLEYGQSMRTLCPFCGGGRSLERSLSITREAGGLLYHCHRASCDESGFVGTGTHGSACDPYSDLAYCQRASNPYRGELNPLQDRDYEYFEKRFDLVFLPPYAIQRTSMFDNDAQYVMSLNDYRGYTRGFAVRRGGWSGEPKTPGKVENTSPKTKTFLDTPRAFAQHIQRPRLPMDDGETVVVVEDYISALKVAQDGWIGVALMGTTMNGDRAREIYQLRPTEVVIALDKDATENAFRMAREWGLSWPKTRVAMLEQDLKDTSKDDITEVLHL